MSAVEERFGPYGGRYVPETLIAALDGVISVCSWIVHLAGALRKEVLVLAPFVPEWRYGLSESKMAWYPSAKILRQQRPGEWDPVLEDLCKELPLGVERIQQSAEQTRSPMRYDGGGTAIYDFQSSPYTYDLVSFLTNARENGCRSVAFVPGERPSKLTKNQERYRWENLILPLARLWGEVYVCTSRAEARKLESDCRWPRNYKVDAPTFGHTLDQALRMRSPEAIKPSPTAMAWAASQLGDLSKTVTLTIRRSVANPGRDSKLAAWAGFARHVAAQGYRPIFIPDAEKPEMETPFEVCAEAAFDVDKRLALYSAAMLNTGVNNGPMGLCWYSRTLPYLTLRMLDSSQRETSREYFLLCGWTPGEQYPWVGPNQRIVWEDDTEGHLVAAFQQWLARRHEP